MLCIYLNIIKHEKLIIIFLFVERIPVSSLLLSAFSHSSIIHLSFNMFALHSFCRGKQKNIIICILNSVFVDFKLIFFQYLGVIQLGDMSPEEFSAMYISSCVVSSLASILFRRSIKSPGISLGAVSII